MRRGSRSGDGPGLSWDLGPARVRPGARAWPSGLTPEGIVVALRGRSRRLVWRGFFSTGATTTAPGAGGGISTSKPKRCPGPARVPATPRIFEDAVARPAQLTAPAG